MCWTCTHASHPLDQPTTTKPAHHLERKNSPASFSHLRQNLAQCNRSQGPGKHHHPTSVDGAYELPWGRFPNEPLCQPPSSLSLLSCRPASPRAGLLHATPRTRNSSYHPLGFIVDCKTLCNITSPYYLVKQPPSSLILDYPSSSSGVLFNNTITNYLLIHDLPTERAKHHYGTQEHTLQRHSSRIDAPPPPPPPPHQLMYH
ncbi:uncharacterized protein LY79DRAFT_132167 [Colletotrichum navitas]|uniref:Uncharacterized protein n=1 Tax=Colletotrichum navitas TaxID=681940 RepID=A0AAD8Q2W3_9PEZI|nr:uncharacterized protein LY79DRAFT_132167 [Colletotrichum navitas]KAK1594549.1 hypothetical protein LY79DRAFT_132167 [Colletotrichum navitas]